MEGKKEGYQVKQEVKSPKFFSRGVDIDIGFMRLIDEVNFVVVEVINEVACCGDDQDRGSLKPEERFIKELKGVKKREISGNGKG